MPIWSVGGMCMPLWTLNLLSQAWACCTHMRTHQLLPPLPTDPHGSQALADRMAEGRGGRGQHRKHRAVAGMSKARLEVIG